MKLFLIAGEASGDLHGSLLIRQLLKLHPNWQIHGWGGDKMEEAGASILKHYRALAFMGFWEVIKNLATIRKNFKICKNQIAEFDPDAVVFIDYPGFNLRMAKWVKKRSIHTVYYISPQLWAWKAGRIKTIRAFIDRMITILPFEQDWYAKRNYEVSYVGHPLIEVIKDFKPDMEFRKAFDTEDQKVIALLPGSRKQEISKVLPIMIDACANFSKHRCIIAGAPNIDQAFYESIIGKSQLSIVYDKTYDLLSIADAACVTSGTATLETALFQVPQVVCYKGSQFSYQIAKRVIQVEYISLVNLIMEKPILTELIQKEFNRDDLTLELNKILLGPERAIQLDHLQHLQKKLGATNASEQCANLISDLLKS